MGAAWGIGFLLWNLRRENAYLAPALSARLTGGEEENARSVLECGDSSPFSTDATGRVSQTADKSSHSTGRFALPLGVIIVSLAVLAFWNFRHTERVVVRRAFSVGNVNDFSWRNRVTAWGGALQMIADRPWLGFGWNQAERVYYSFYQPNKLAEGAAIQMNDYFMLGASLGFPALVCFGAYLWLSFGRPKSEVRSPKSEEREKDDCLKATCRASAIVLLVGFWFDGGLFKLATAVPFWMLLALVREEATTYGHRFTRITVINPRETV
jgi:O-antigen ligase